MTAPANPAPSAPTKGHTPGPWVSDGFNSGVGQYVVASERGLIVALCGGPPGSEECEANAALIVRAVNEREGLIAALREADGSLADALPFLHCGCDDTKVCVRCSTRNGVRASLAAARAAIARATGEGSQP